MKKINKFLGLGLGVVAAFSLASCSNDVNEPNNTPNNEDVVLNLVKTPDFYAWSGSQVLGDTRATRGYADDGTGHNYYYCNEEVEINLSILDEHKNDAGNAKYKVGDLVAKLSVHVRTATDVTITLPMFADYIIDSDDLAIFNKHDNLFENTVDTDHQFTAMVNDQQVKVALTFSPETVEIEELEGVVEEGEQPNQVTVSITGVDADVLEYCMDNYKDGLNFEVYIYLQNENTTANRTAFKAALNESKVAFTVAPNYYINAFGFEYDNGEKQKTVNPNDCKVKPVEESGLTLFKENAAHTNGTSFNTIYTKLENDKVDHAHGGTYDPQVEDENGEEGGDDNNGGQQDA